MTDQLSAQQIQQIKGLYGISDNFRSEFNKLVGSEIGKAKTLISQLSKLSLDGTSEDKPDVGKKRRGRPPGVKNKAPSKPRAKKAAVTEPTTAATESAHTHGSAILSVLTKDGLGASEIFDALGAANLSGYNMPEKKTLYTTLSSMKSKGLLKTKGDRPNIKYIKP